MNLHELSLRACLDVISNGGRIDHHITSVAHDPVLLGGAVKSLIGAYESIRVLGVVPRSDDAELDAFLHSGVHAMQLAFHLKLADYDNQRPWLQHHIESVIRVINANRDGRKFSMSEPAPAPAPAPLAISIASMPVRETSTAVTYDTAGNIAATTQTEKDI